MMRAEQGELIRHKDTTLAPLLNERTRRCWVATEGQALGYGGISTVTEALGIARGTIHAGLREAQGGSTVVVPQRIRSFGGGRRQLTEEEATLVETLKQVGEPRTRGDPESPLRWTCKSMTRLAQELKRAGHPIRQRRVGPLLQAQQ
jgi:hypothetical protein